MRINAICQTLTVTTSDIYIYTHARKRAHTHTHARARARAHTHTHTHTHVHHKPSAMIYKHYAWTTGCVNTYLILRYFLMKQKNLFFYKPGFNCVQLETNLTGCQPESFVSSDANPFRCRRLSIRRRWRLSSLCRLWFFWGLSWPTTAWKCRSVNRLYIALLSWPTVAWKCHR